MNLKNKKLSLIAGVILLGVIGCEEGSPVLTEESTTILKKGTFAPLSGYEGMTEITGVVNVICDQSKTIAIVDVIGVDPINDPLKYPTHLHADSCANNGGGHYKIDPSVEGAVESNEIWPIMNNSQDGKGAGTAESDDPTACDADGAMSIVIHDPENSNAKMLCADLI